VASKNPQSNRRSVAVAPTRGLSSADFTRRRSVIDKSIDIKPLAEKGKAVQGLASLQRSIDRIKPERLDINATQARQLILDVLEPKFEELQKARLASGVDKDQPIAKKAAEGAQEQVDALLKDLRELNTKIKGAKDPKAKKTLETAKKGLLKKLKSKEALRDKFNEELTEINDRIRAFDDAAKLIKDKAEELERFAEDEEERQRQEDEEEQEEDQGGGGGGGGGDQQEEEQQQQQPPTGSGGGGSGGGGGGGGAGEAPKVPDAQEIPELGSIEPATAPQENNSLFSDGSERLRQINEDLLRSHSEGAAAFAAQLQQGYGDLAKNFGQGLLGRLNTFRGAQRTPRVSTPNSTVGNIISGGRSVGGTGTALASRRTLSPLNTRSGRTFRSPFSSQRSLKPRVAGSGRRLRSLSSQRNFSRGLTLEEVLTNSRSNVAGSTRTLKSQLANRQPASNGNALHGLSNPSFGRSFIAPSKSRSSRALTGHKLRNK